MRKVMYIMIIFNLILFFVVSFVSYSNQICLNVLQGKTMIHIIRPANMSNSKFVKSIEELSRKTGIDILYRSTRNTPDFERQEYIFYRTNNQKDFIHLHTEVGQSAFVSPELHLSTKNEENAKKIYGSTFFFDVLISDFAELSDADLDRNIYYVSLNKADLFIQNLEYFGMTASKFMPSETGFEGLPVINAYQCFLLIFLLCSTSFYCFSRDKEIMIKKVAGYSSSDILAEEMKLHFTVTLFVFLIGKTIVLFIIALNYQKSLWDYCAYVFPRDATMLLIMCAVIGIGSVYVIWAKDISYIKGNTKSNNIYISSTFGRIGATLVAIYYISTLVSYSVSVVTATKSLSIVKERVANYYTTTMNVANADMEGDYGYYEQYVNSFFNYMTKEYDPIICYTGMSDMNGRDMLLVNVNYIKSSLIEGNDSDTDNDEYYKDCILVPDDISDLYMQKYHIQDIYSSIKKSGVSPNVKRYSANNKVFFTYESTSFTDNVGYVVNPIIIVCSEDELLPFSMAIVSNGNLLFECHSNEEIYNELFPTLRMYHLDNIITETPRIETLFHSCIASLQIQIYRSLFESIMYFIVLIVLIWFDTVIYYQTYKKAISVKTLNGYGMYAYRSSLCVNILSAAVCLLVTLVLQFNILIAAFVLIINFALLLLMMQKLQNSNIAQTLKGEV